MAHIEEAYVSLEVAKLLKEKGFEGKEWCSHAYYDESLIDYTLFGFCCDDKEFVYAPTQQMAMSWLREEKNILIFIVPAKDESNNLKYGADVWTWNEGEGLYEPTWFIDDYIYEKAVEAAIKYCLENLI